MSDNILASGGGGGGQVDFTVTQASHGFSATPPTAIYYGPAAWIPSQANNEASVATHVVIAVNGNDFTATNLGRVTVTGHTLTPGEYYFVSDTTPGLLVSTEPEGINAISNPMVFVEDSNTLHIFPFRPSKRGTALDPGWTYFSPWTSINTNSFYVSNNTTNLAIFKPGRPLRYRQNPFNWGWGIVNSVVPGSPTPADLTINLSGTSFSSGYDEMLFGEFTKVSTVSFNINGLFADANDTALLLNDLNYRYRWTGGEAYCVMVTHRVIADDTAGSGQNPFVNLLINGSGVCSANTYGGRRTLAASWVDTQDDIDASNYAIDYNDSIEVAVRQSSGNDDTSDLSIQGVFVFR